MSKSIAKKIEERIGNVTVTEVVNTKVNVSKNGYQIDNGSDLNPVIYVPDYVEDIVDYVVDTYENLPDTAIDLNALQDRDYVLSHTFPHVINAKRNTDLLDTVVWKSFLDLAIVWRIDMGDGTCLLTKKHADLLNIGLDDLENIKREYDISCLSEKIFGHAIPDDPMKLITTYGFNFGASAIADDDILREVSNRFGWKKFVILPSSIHELILLPDDMGMDVEYAKKMVHDINRTDLSPEDFLSDSVYMWNGDKVVFA